MSRIPYPIRVLVVLIGVSVVAGAVVNADVIYVDDDAPNDPGPGDSSVSDPTEDGSTDHPFDAIQEGINAAVDEDEVVVLPGTYTGDGNRDLDFSHGLPEGQTRAITVRSTDPEDADVVAATVIDCQGIPAEPHRGFRFHLGEGPESVVSGLTITNGLAPAEQVEGDLTSAGGAIFCVSASPTISYCRLIGNSAAPGELGTMSSPEGGQGGHGGAICCVSSGATMLITHCTISANGAGNGGHGWYGDGRDGGNGGNGGSGGALHFINSHMTIAHCTISGNGAGSGGSGPRDAGCGRGGNGGGIYCDSTSGLTIADCILSGNGAGGGCPGGDGGALRCGGTITITDTSISRNRAGYGSCRYYGGQFGGNGGAVFCGPDTDLTILNCTIDENAAGQGGPGGTFQASGGSGGAGGGIYCGPGVTLIAIRCVVNANTAGSGGLAYLGYGGNGGSGGGAYCASTSDVTVINCVISGNIAGNGECGGLGGTGGHGGGIHYDSRYYASGIGLKLVNTMVLASAAGNGGCGAYVAGDGGDGGGVCCAAANDHEHAITNCTIIGNSSGLAGGASAENGRGAGVFVSDITLLSNSILWYNTDADGEGETAQIYGANGVPVIHHCSIESWTGDRPYHPPGARF